MSKLHQPSLLLTGPLARRALSSLILALVVASIEEQNDQHSQCKEADGKMRHVAQVRTHEDCE